MSGLLAFILVFHTVVVQYGKRIDLVMLREENFGHGLLQNLFLLCGMTFRFSMNLSEYIELNIEFSLA